MISFVNYNIEFKQTMAMITKIRLQNWKSFKDSTIYIDSLGILIGTNASGKSNVLDAFAFLRAVGEGKSLLDAIQTVRGGEDWIIRRGEDSFCIEIEIEIDGSSYLLDLRVIKRNSVFSFDSCEIHRLGTEANDIVPGKFIDSARNITWKMYDVPISLDFWAKIYATFRNIIILDPVPAKMRDYCKISKELKSDGSNVAGVLCALAPEEKKKVEALVSSYVRPLPERDINRNKMIPFISYVTRDENGDSHVNLLEEKENLAKLMASGTIGRMMVNVKI